MDHILENEANPIPDPSAAAAAAPARELVDVDDGDDEDEEALRSLLRTQPGGSGAVEEAKVRPLHPTRCPKAPMLKAPLSPVRASNAQSAARRSRTRRWRTTTRRRAATPSLRSLRRRFVSAMRAGVPDSSLEAT